MLSILGLGSAYPSNEYGDQGTGDLGSVVRPGDLSCVPRLMRPRTVLPTDYLSGTRPHDFLDAPLLASESPTDLGFRAAQVALERAGVAPEQLGLIVGDCATPREKTPSEAQRIGKRFNIKVPAFDITAGSVAFVQHLDTLDGWLPERTPEYVLVVSTNCPTENLTPAQIRESPFRFCDAASAMVLSRRHRGRLSVRASAVGTDPRFAQMFSINTFGGLALDTQAADECFASYIDRSLSEITQQQWARQGEFRLICSLASRGALESIASAFDVDKEDRWFEQILDQGDSLGSSVGRVLADRWAELGSGRDIVVAVCGSGMSYGYVVLG